jgi:radical SAM protein with 4Fe4S-binding SPASM domain
MRHVHRAAPESPVLNYETRCPCGTQYCRITPDGKLTPCPYLPTVAGDLRSESFSSVWGDSELFRQIRSGNLSGKCGTCEYRQMCGGCRARAYAVEGDVLASDPSCSYEPAGGEIVRTARSVSYGSAPRRGLRWSSEAEARVSRIPSFVRGVVMDRIEDYARRQGATEVTLELMREVRRAMPVDFSKRAPFFLSDD